jgi:hypothetical protein
MCQGQTDGHSIGLIEISIDSLCEEGGRARPMLAQSEFHQFGGEVEESTNVLGIVQRPQSFSVLRG